MTDNLDMSEEGHAKRVANAYAAADNTDEGEFPFGYVAIAVAFFLIIACIWGIAFLDKIHF